MLPDPIIGTYQRYKQDTTRLTAWLSKAAILCGYEPPNAPKKHAPVEPERPTSNGARLKGRARKEAREAAKLNHAKEEVTKPKSTPKYGTTTRQLLEQARLIVSCKEPVINVPQAIVRIGSRAIEARRTCVTWFDSHGEADQVSRERHLKFVEILEEVTLILSSALQTVASRVGPERSPNIKPKLSKPANEKRAACDTIDNMFKALEFEESVSDDEDLVPEVSLKGSQQELNNSVFELEPPKDDDCVFELFCFFRDMTEMRQHLCGTWKRYKQGDIDLVTATLVTVAAVYCVKDLEEDLAQRCSLFQKNPRARFDVLIKHFISKDKWTLHSEKDGDLENFYTFAETVSAIIHYRNEFAREVSARQVKCGCSAVYPNALVAPAIAMSGSIKSMPRAVGRHVHHEHSVVYKLLFDNIWMITCPSYLDKDKLPITDILSEGFRRVYHNDITIWTVFATRALLDAHGILGTDIKGCYTSLQKFAFELSTQLGLKDIDGALHVDDEWKWDNCGKALYRAWGTSYFHVPRNRFVREKGNPCVHFTEAKLAEFAAKGIIEDGKQEEDETGSSKWILRDKDPAYYFKHNVLNNGMTHLSMALDLEEVSLDFENHYAGIFATAHLYNACRCLKWIGSSWPEMEKAIGVHRETIFGSTIPTAPGDIYNCYIRRIGVPARAWASDPRGVTTQRYTKAPMKGNQLFEILRNHHYGERTSSQYLCDLRSLLEDPAGKKLGSARANTDWSVLKLLGALEKRAAKDIAQVEGLNVLTLSRKCCKLLRQIDAALAAKHGNIYDLQHVCTAPNQILRWSEMITRALQGMAETLQPERNYVVQISNIRPEDGPQRLYHRQRLLNTTAKVIEEFLSPTNDGK